MTTELSNPHDRFFKEVWSRKDVGQDFLRHYLPAEVVDLLDLRSPELSKESFIDAQLRWRPSSICAGNWRPNAQGWSFWKRSYDI